MNDFYYYLIHMVGWSLAHVVLHIVVDIVKQNLDVASH